MFDVIVFLAVQKVCLQKLWLTKSKQRIDLPGTFSCVILHDIGPYLTKDFLSQFSCVVDPDIALYLVITGPSNSVTKYVK